MKLQKGTELALYSVLEFAGAPERHISATEIADKYGVSSHHLAKVLAQSGYAVSVERRESLSDETVPFTVTTGEARGKK